MSPDDFAVGDIEAGEFEIGAEHVDIVTIHRRGGPGTIATTVLTRAGGIAAGVHVLPGIEKTITGNNITGTVTTTSGTFQFSGSKSR